MAGYSVNRKRPALLGDGWQVSDDPCSLQFQLELVGVRSEIASGLSTGDVLDVVLVSRSEAVSAVCRSPSGEIVGALAAFRGLAQLIRCLREGVGYVALVLEASSTRCEVTVGRAE